MTGPRPSDSRERLNQRLGESLELLGMLGRGGMGSVFEARHRESGARLAVKLLEGTRSSRQLERFRREGQIVAGLRHPGIVKVHSAGEVEGGRPFLVYELVDDARSLTEASGSLPLRRRAELVRDAARALGYAHDQGVVHRDVKPDNLLVNMQDQVKVTDFGVARAESLDRMTQAGAMVGTPSYMSPEQVAGQQQRIGPPTDVWALGVVLYQALTGELPFEGQNVVQLGAVICGSQVEPPHEVDPEVSRPLSEVCLKALAKAPKDRYPNGAALADAIDQALAGRTPLPAWAPWLASLAASALVFAAVAYWALSEEPRASELASPSVSESVPVSPTIDESPSPTPTAAQTPPHFTPPTPLVELYLKGALSGDLFAAGQLGRTLLNDHAEVPAALYWLNHAAERDNPHAQAELALWFEARQQPPDLVAALGWYERGAVAGNRTCAYRLAKAYRDGGALVGGVQDTARYESYLARAVELGDGGACLERAALYRAAGELEQAFALYERAADSISSLQPEAWLVLADMLAAGEGTEADLVAARWRLKQLLERWPDSLLAPQARARLEELRE